MERVAYRIYEEREGSVMQTGTLIHGTLRAEDLIPAFWAEIRRIGGRESLEDIYAEYGDLLVEAVCTPEQIDVWDEHMELLEVLQDRLNDLAPEGMYFGAHIGDGSDFGFWPIDDMEV